MKYYEIVIYLMTVLDVAIGHVNGTGTPYVIRVNSNSETIDPVDIYFKTKENYSSYSWADFPFKIEGAIKTPNDRFIPPVLMILHGYMIAFYKNTSDFEESTLMRTVEIEKGYITSSYSSVNPREFLYGLDYSNFKQIDWERVIYTDDLSPSELEDYLEQSIERIKNMREEEDE